MFKDESVTKKIRKDFISLEMNKYILEFSKSASLWKPPSEISALPQLNNFSIDQLESFLAHLLVNNPFVKSESFSLRYF